MKEKGVRYIKIMDGVEVNYDGEIIRVERPSELWELFHWDVENDPDARAAASEVNRWLYATGYLDMTPTMPKGHTLTLRAIPVKD